MTKGPASAGGALTGGTPLRPLLLLIGDDAFTRGLGAGLEPEFTVQPATTPEEVFAALEQREFQVVVCGHASWLEAGGDLPDVVAARTGSTALVTLSGPLATAARALGTHPAELEAAAGLDEVRLAVDRAVTERHRRVAEENWHQAFGREMRDNLFIGTTPSMRAVFGAAEQVAQTNVPVFVTGESGTGKEFLSRYIHLKSPRHGRPFYAVNCAGFTESLMASEVFGHARGAFTGAHSEHKGCIELADHSTLLLDEIAELKPDLQSRLLRVVESRTVTRLGSEKSIPVDVRFIAAAQRKPEDLMREGQLREDLYYRLGVVTLTLPPLRERVADIEVLADFLLGIYRRELDKDLGPISPEALSLFRRYRWPGNVREFRNVIERAAIFARPGEPIRPAHLPPELHGSEANEQFTVEARANLTLDEVSQRYARFVLAQCGGNRARAARILGVAPSTLWRWGKEAAGE